MKSFLVKNPIKAPFLFLAFFVLVFAIDFSSPAAAVTQPPATTPSSSISFEKQEELKQLFFETEGTLKPVDTTLHQKGDGFIMDQARYRLQASTQLSNQNPININYQDLNISLIPNNLNPQTKEGRLIQNGSEIDGTDNPKLKDKGIIYDNAYGNGTSLGFIPNPMELQKVLKLTKEAAQQNPNPSFTLTLPKDATFTVGNQNWDKTQPLEVKGKTIHLRYQDTDAYLQPAKVWDSNGNETQITLTLEQNPDGSITLTKHLPEEFLQTATFPIYTDADITFGAESVFNSATSSYISVSALDSTHVVAVYRDSGNSNYGTAVVGTVSGTDISFGSEAVFNSAASYYTSVSALDSTHVVAVYRDAGNSDYGTAIVGTVSGTDISFGAESVFNSALSSYTSVSALDSTHVVAVYQDFGNSSYGTAIVGTISGTDISFGAESVFNSGTSSYTSVSALDSTHVVAVYRDDSNSNYGTAVVGTVASNTAPSISAGPSDGGSSSASPTTVGSNVTFTATATDGESDQYYLAICKTNSVTAVNSAAPTCGGGSWAISSATASGSQASVTYATVAGDSESNAWFAFVCDNNASSLCSSSSQGSGTTGSPFEVNHVPTFTSVANTSGYLNTGDTLTFTSVASDSDTSGTADTVTLYICKSNDFTGTACGAGGSWATSSASSSNPSATYTVLSGDTDGTITYYANLIDDSSAEASANPLTGTFQIDNTAPTVSLTGSLTWPAPLTTSFTPTASASDATSGIATYAWSQTAGSGTLTFSSASTLSTSITVDATGTYTVQLTVTDTAGNQTTSSFDLTWSNPSFGGGGNGSGGGFSGGSGGSSCPAPSGTWTFQINQGQPTTQTRAVTLSFTSNPPITPSTLISDTPITVTLANDSAFTNAVSKPYQPELPYTLTKDQGTKTVYAKLQNSCGSFTPTLSAAIDYIPPPFTFKMPFLFTRTLAPGDQGNDVKELQLFLTSLNLFPTTIIANGYYGPTTTGSVRKFQQSNNILQTGTFGPLTRRAANIIQLTRAIRQLEEYLAKLAE